MILSLFQFLRRGKNLRPALVFLMLNAGILRGGRIFPNVTASKGAKGPVAIRTTAAFGMIEPKDRWVQFSFHVRLCPEHVSEIT